MDPKEDHSTNENPQQDTEPQSFTDWLIPESFKEI